MANSRHWFTTSFLRRNVPESDARSVREWSPLPCSHVAGRGVNTGTGMLAKGEEGKWSTAGPSPVLWGCQQMTESRA